MDLKPEIRALVLYGLVGLSNTVVSAGIMAVSDYAGVPVAVYTLYAYVAGMIQSFLLNRSLTFRSSRDKAWFRRVARFVIVNLSLLGTVQLLQYVLISHAGLHKAIAIAIGMVWYTAAGYILNKLWVFKSEGEHS